MASKTKTPAKSPAKKAAKSAKPTVKTKAKPAPAKAAAKPAKKAIAKPVTKKAAAKPAAKKPAAKSAKPAPKPVAKAKGKATPAKAIVRQPAPKAPAKPAKKPVAAAKKPAAPVKPAPPAKAKPAPSPVPEKMMSQTAARSTKTATRPKSSKKIVAGDRPALPMGYRPEPGEEYMGPKQLEFFRQKLLNWRGELVEESKQTIDNLREEVRDVGDDAERATRETEYSLELRTRDRYRKLISKIDKALKRIEDGSYGYCEETGEEIGLERLEARPIATMTLDAQERWEHRQKLMGD